jgi:tetratricopeptide (TPR) repeat protein
MTEVIRKKVLEGLQLKLVGNDRLKAGKYEQARETYTEALRCVLAAVEMLHENISAAVDQLELVKRDIEDLRLQLVSNLSLVEIKLELWRDALDHASMVLAVDRGNSKALFRRSVARVRLGQQLEGARVDLQHLLETSPGSEEIKRELVLCQTAVKKTDPRTETFNKNLRKKMTRVHTSSTYSSIINSWMESFGSVMAQCGGKRS